MGTAETIELFKNFLAERKLSFTRERQEILRVICGFNRAFGVEDICAALVAAKMPLAGSTVYRNIDLLRAAGIIESASFCSGDRKRSQFKRMNPRRRHYQLHCLDCETVKQIQSEELDRAILDICNKYDISPEGLVVKIEGRRRCKGCPHKN